MPTSKAQENPEFEWEEITTDWTWPWIVRRALVALDGTAPLSMLYRIIERHPRTKQLKYWKSKVRQVLQTSSDFVRIEKGVWSYATKHSPEEVERRNAVRRERYPLKSKSES